MICVGKSKRLFRSNFVSTGLQSSRTKRNTILLTRDKEGDNNKPSALSIHDRHFSKLCKQFSARLSTVYTAFKTQSPETSISKIQSPWQMHNLRIRDYRTSSCVGHSRHTISRNYTKYCIECHQFYLFCSILIGNHLCSVTNIKCKM